MNYTMCPKYEVEKIFSTHADKYAHKTLVMKITVKWHLYSSYMHFFTGPSSSDDSCTTCADAKVLEMCNSILQF